MRQPRDAEVDQPQAGDLVVADRLEDHVVRLDVAMDDAGAVECGDAARELDRIVEARGQRHARRPRQPALQRLPLVERHRGVEAGLALRRELDRLADPGAADARRDPRLAQEGVAQHALRAGDRLGKLQDDAALLDQIVGLEDPGVAAVRKHRPQMKSVEGRAGLRHRQRREVRGGKGEIGRVGRRQPDDVDHQRRGVVAGACRQPGGDELARGLVGRVAPRQDRGDGLIRDAAMDAVAGEQIAVIEAHRIARIIDADALVGADRAGEDVPQAGARHRMVGGHPVERAVPPAIGAGVADMDHMDAAAAQDERGQRRRHAGERGVARADSMRPGIEGLDGAGAVALNAERRVLAEMSLDEGAHRELRRHPAARGAADAVGDHGDRAEARLLVAVADIERGIVLVRLARTGLGRDTEAKLKPRRMPGWTFGVLHRGGVPRLLKRSNTRFLHRTKFARQ